MNAIEIADSEKTISLEQISVLIVKEATNVLSAVQTFKKHPSYDSRANLKARYNRLVGMFSLGLMLNGYNELPNTPEGKSPRNQVNLVRTAVEMLYEKKGKK